MPYNSNNNNNNYKRPVCRVYLGSVGKPVEFS